MDNWTVCFDGLCTEFWNKSNILTKTIHHGLVTRQGLAHHSAVTFKNYVHETPKRSAMIFLIVNTLRPSPLKLEI